MKNRVVFIIFTVVIVLATFSSFLVGKSVESNPADISKSASFTSRTPAANEEATPERTGAPGQDSKVQSTTTSVLETSAAAAALPDPPRRVSPLYDGLSYEIEYQGKYPEFSPLTAENLRNATIYVAIPTYRDPECPLTVDELFQKAAYPDRVHVGIAQYNLSPHDDFFDCAIACQSCTQRASQIRIRRLAHSLGAGPSTSRGQSVTMYNGENFYLQIDSHTIFKHGWDVMLIEQLYFTGSPKPFLAAYPMPYEVERDADLVRGTPRILKRDPLEGTAGFMPYICGGKVRLEGDYNLIDEAISAAIPLTDRPLRITHYAGGFTFSPAMVLKEVLFDPKIRFLFGPDETLQAARLWTSGWDLYAPNATFMFHHYFRHGRPKFWDSKPNQKWFHDMMRAARRAEYILGRKTRDQLDPNDVDEILLDIERYSLGTARTNEEWERFLGVNWNIEKYEHCSEYYDDEAGGWLPLHLRKSKRDSATSQIRLT